MCQSSQLGLGMSFFPPLLEPQNSIFIYLWSHKKTYKQKTAFPSNQETKGKHFIHNLSSGCQNSPDKVFDRVGFEVPVYGAVKSRQGSVRYQLVSAHWKWPTNFTSFFFFAIRFRSNPHFKIPTCFIPPSFCISLLLSLALSCCQILLPKSLNTTLILPCLVPRAVNEALGPVISESGMLIGLAEVGPCQSRFARTTAP